jgi:nucleoside-triphosphatase THEP1
METEISSQLNIYNRIMHIATMENPPPVHVDGRAGRGKTYVLYPIIGAMRKTDQIVLVTASSAFAAKNYPGGRTTHFLYGIPVDEYNPHLKSNVGPKSDRAQLLRAAKCHVVDEIGGLHFKAFDCADRLMRSLTGINRVWGGRMLITIGDFRQVRPNNCLEVGMQHKSS